ncbi:DUF2508 family protein [Clostridiaceae bacterium OttesenSCG-928-D20]|nr:DUF2508 family protein [Clostridiaceae bacterium OttesenSCG-928-D20]
MSKKQDIRRKARIESSAREEIARIKDGLSSCYTQFNNLSDPQLMDACIFEISALRAKYNYALQRAKEQLQ